MPYAANQFDYPAPKARLLDALPRPLSGVRLRMEFGQARNGSRDDMPLPLLQCEFLLELSGLFLSAFRACSDILQLVLERFECSRNRLVF
jgi:hypothetical protein